MTNTSMQSALVLAALLAGPLPAAAQTETLPDLPPPTAQAPRAARPVTVATPPAWDRRIQTQAPKPAGIDRDETGPQAFSVVLVLGDMQTATAQDNVPAAARKALADMKDFLPYKGYRLLDAQWTLCCGNYPATSRLKGPDEQEYELQLSTTNIANGRVNVRFYLSEAISVLEHLTLYEAPVASTGAAADIEKRLSALRVERTTALQRVGDRHPDVQKLNAQIAELERQIAETGGRRSGSLKRGSRGIIDASFRMDVGETVVVGTSRVKGDKALIALLTAVPPKTPAAR